MCSGIDKFVRYFCEFDTCVARLYVVPVFCQVFCAWYSQIFLTLGRLSRQVHCLLVCAPFMSKISFVLSLFRGSDFVSVWFDGLCRVFVPLPSVLVSIFRLDVDSFGPLYPDICS
jgi:hypothetical protein